MGLSVNLTAVCVCVHIAAGNVGPSSRVERHADRQEIGKQHERSGVTSSHCLGEYG